MPPIYYATVQLTPFPESRIVGPKLWTSSNLMDKQIMASDSPSSTTSNTHPIGLADERFETKVEEKAVLRGSPHPTDDRSLLLKHEEEIEEPHRSLDTNKRSGYGTTVAGIDDDPHTPTKPKKRKRGWIAGSQQQEVTGDGFESPPSNTDNVTASTEPINLPQVKLPFPWKLHALLDDVQAEGKEDIVSWDGDGKSFTVHKPKDFCDHIMVKYFRQSKLSSFTRQLYIYGFSKVEGSSTKSTFFHPMFVRGNRALSLSLGRNLVGDRRKKHSSPGVVDDVSPLLAMAKPSGTGETSAAPSFRSDTKVGLDPQMIPPSQQHRLLLTQDTKPLFHNVDLSPLPPAEIHPFNRSRVDGYATTTTTANVGATSSSQQHHHHHTRWEYMVNNGPSTNVAVGDFKRYVMAPMFHQLQQQGLPSGSLSVPIHPLGGSTMLGASNNDDGGPISLRSRTPQEGRRMQSSFSYPAVGDSGDIGFVATSSSTSNPVEQNERRPLYYDEASWDLEPRPIEDMVADGLPGLPGGPSRPSRGL